MIRETTFTTFIKPHHELSIPKKGDFLVDEQYLFKVEGKNKSFKHIKDIENSFIVTDDIEIGFGNKIPL